MTWFWLKRWLNYTRRKSLHRQKQKIQNGEFREERETTSSNSSEEKTSVYIKDYGDIPLWLANAAYVIEKNIKTKGLFQTKGDIKESVSRLLNQVNKSRLKSVNVHDAIETLKSFLVSMPTPLLPAYVCDALINISEKDIEVQYIFVLRELRNLSAFNFMILHYIMDLLKKISDHSSHNCMDTRKLATVFVLDALSPLIEEGPTRKVCLGGNVQRLPFLITIVENLIRNVSMFKNVGSVSSIAPASTEYEQSFNYQNIKNTCLMSEELTKECQIQETRNLTILDRKNSEPGIEKVVQTSVVHEIRSVIAGKSKNNAADILPLEYKPLQTYAAERNVGVPSNAIFATNIPSKSSFNKKKKFRTVAKIKSSDNRKKTVQSYESRTSPEGKPVKFGYRKKGSNRHGKKKKNSCLGGQGSLDEQDGLKLHTWVRKWDNKGFQVAPLTNGYSSNVCMPVLVENSRASRVLESNSNVTDNLYRFSNHNNIQVEKDLENTELLLSDQKLQECREFPEMSVPGITGPTSSRKAASSMSMTLISRADEGSHQIKVKYASRPSSSLAKHFKKEAPNGSINTEIKNISSTLLITLKSSSCNKSELLAKGSKELSTVVKVSASSKTHNDKMLPNISYCKNRKKTQKPCTAHDSTTRDQIAHSTSENNTNVLGSSSDSIVKSDENAVGSSQIRRTSAYPETSQGSIQQDHREGTSNLERTVSPASDNVAPNLTDNHQVIIVTVKNKRSKSRPRCHQHPQYLRMRQALAAQRRRNLLTNNGLLSERSTFGQLIVDMFLVCMIMLCICLLLYNLHCTKIYEHWHK